MINPAAVLLERVARWNSSVVDVLVMLYTRSAMTSAIGLQLQ